MPYLIGIDASRAVRDKRTGTENYSWFLIRELLKLDQKNRYRLYAPKMPADDFGEFPNADWKIIPQQRMWSQLALAKEINTNTPDVFFAPSHVVPLLAKVKSVATVHDLAYKYFPKSYAPLALRYLNFATTTSISKSSAILTPSESSKRDIEKFYKPKGKNIIVTPLGYDKNVFNATTKHGDAPIDEPYIYFVGRIEARKNILLLIDAFILLSKENRPVNLVLAGKPGYGYEQIREKIDSLPPTYKAKIKELGFVSDEESARYLKHATIFAYPSQYEGFGLPILEAMAIGTPVVSSNSSSLPEVAGEAATLLAPSDPLTWAAAFSRIIHQKDLAEKLIKKGTAQAEKFSWQNTAKQTLQVLENVAGK